MSSTIQKKKTHRRVHNTFTIHVHIDFPNDMFGAVSEAGSAETETRLFETEAEDKISGLETGLEACLEAYNLEVMINCK